MTFVPIDLEQQCLADGLAAYGFRSGRPAFFHWLGVVPYLTRDAIAGTLRFIVGVPGSEVVFDYSEPLEKYPPERRANVIAVSARTAAIGEPWLSYFDSAELLRELHARGYGEIEDRGIAEIAVRFFDTRKCEAKDDPGPHIIHARRSRCLEMRQRRDSGELVPGVEPSPLEPAASTAHLLTAIFANF